MATNQFFSSNFHAVNKDQTLVQSLITESIKAVGINCMYVPRTLINYDELFGEDQSSLFEKSYEIELYVKTVDNFGGDGKFLSKFGLEIRDEINFSVSKPRFIEAVARHNDNMSKPREGDLIWVPQAIDKRARLFEISYVSSEEVYYQLGNVYTWEIRTKVFELGGENFSTGNTNIDSIENNEIKPTFILGSGSGSFIVGESVTFSNGSTGVVFDHTFNNLIVSDMKGEVPTSGSVTGAGASYTITDLNQLDDSNNPGEFTNNEYTESTVVDFLDLSEINLISK